MVHHELFGVRIDDLSQDELRGCVSGWLCGDRARVIVTPNPEFLLLARRDESFRDLLTRADLSLPDGVGLRFAIPAVTGERLLNRHTGVDTLVLIANVCAATGKRLALLGGDPGIADRAAQTLRDRIPGLLVEGIDPGPVDPQHLPDTLTPSLHDSITPRLHHSTTPSLHHFSVLALALGQGKQERVMESLRTSAPLNLPTLRILIGVGGALDMLAGTRRRAPARIRHAGLEWVWRLAIEPRRWKRIFHAFPGFPAVVIWDTLKHQRFLRACRATIPEILRQLAGI